MKFYLTLSLSLFFYLFLSAQCTVPGDHNGWTLPGWAISTPHTMSGRGEFKVHCGNWPGGSNAWYMAGAITFTDNGITGRAFGDNFTICAPGAFSGWDNSTNMTQNGNQWCFTIPSPGTYDWKPTRCGSWDSWDPNGQRNVNASNWSVTTSSANQQVCVTYDPNTGEVGMQTVLPVTLIKFEVKNENQHNHLFWTTYTEINNDYFEVQCSNNGIDFETVGMVKGAGSSSRTSFYEFIHKSKYLACYYRLKQVDFDGHFTYSPIKFAALATDEISIFPNPTKGVVNIKNDLEIEVELRVYDITGRNLINYLNHETNTLDISHLPAGLYLFSIKNGQELKNIRVLKE